MGAVRGSLARYLARYHVDHGFLIQTLRGEFPFSRPERMLRILRSALLSRFFLCFCCFLRLQTFRGYEMSEIASVVAADLVDLKRLNALVWLGVPPHVSRQKCWELLLGCLPASSENREPTVQRFRDDYIAHNRSTDMTSSGATFSAEDQAAMRQIKKDVPRSASGTAFFQHPRVQLAVERVLFNWATRHPACGYVQGMNDLVLPFFIVVFNENLSIDVVSKSAAAIDAQLSAVHQDHWRVMEADVYILANKFLEKIQDNFVASQQGAHDMVQRFSSIVKTVDPALWSAIHGVGACFFENSRCDCGCDCSTHISATWKFRCLICTSSLALHCCSITGTPLSLPAPILDPRCRYCKIYRPPYLPPVISTRSSPKLSCFTRHMVICSKQPWDSVSLR